MTRTDAQLLKEIEKASKRVIVLRAQLDEAVEIRNSLLRKGREAEIPVTTMARRAGIRRETIYAATNGSI